MAEITLQAHSNLQAAPEGNSYVNALIYTGNDGIMDYGSAFRFELPENFGPSSEVHTATLQLRMMNQVAMSDYRIRIGVPASSSQVLPSDFNNLNSTTVGSNIRNIGVGTFSPPLDHQIPNVHTWINIDVTDMMNEANLASRLGSGFVVFILRPNPYQDSSYCYIHAIGSADAPQLYINYGADSPPPEPEEAQLNETLDNIVLNSEVVLTQIAELNETLDNILLEGRAFEVSKGSVDETLDNISLSSQVKVTNLAEVDETLDNIILNSEVYHGFPPVEASLDETLANVLLEAEAIVVSSDADTDFRLFADHQLFPFNKHNNNIFA